MDPTGESVGGPLRLDFDRWLKLEFHGSRITSDAGLLAYRELDDALGLSSMAGDLLAEARTGRNGRHALVGLLRQSVFGRLAGYEDGRPKHCRKAGRKPRDGRLDGVWDASEPSQACPMPCYDASSAPAASHPENPG